MRGTSWLLLLTIERTNCCVEPGPLSITPPITASSTPRIVLYTSTISPTPTTHTYIPASGVCHRSPRGDPNNTSSQDVAEPLLAALLSGLALECWPCWAYRVHIDKTCFHWWREAARGDKSVRYPGRDERGCGVTGGAGVYARYGLGFAS